jgi:hypothetical protein
MVDTELNGRAVCTLRGEDPREDLNALADAIVEAAGIYIHNDALVWLTEGKLVRINAEVLCEIIRKHVVTEHLVNHGGEQGWALAYYPFEPPTAKALATLLRAEKKEEGSLRARASGLITCARRTRGRSPLTVATRSTPRGTTAL